MAPTLRDATVDDAPALARFIPTIWRDDNPDVEFVASALRVLTRRTMVALDGNTLVGFIDAFPTTSKDGVERWEIDLLAVAPECRLQHAS